MFLSDKTEKQADHMQVTLMNKDKDTIPTAISYFLLLKCCVWFYDKSDKMWYFKYIGWCVGMLFSDINQASNVSVQFVHCVMCPSL